MDGHYFETTSDAKCSSSGSMCEDTCAPSQRARSAASRRLANRRETQQRLWPGRLKSQQNKQPVSAKAPAHRHHGLQPPYALARAESNDCTQNAPAETRPSLQQGEQLLGTARKRATHWASAEEQTSCWESTTKTTVCQRARRRAQDVNLYSALTIVNFCFERSKTARSNRKSNRSFRNKKPFLMQMI